MPSNKDQNSPTADDGSNQTSPTATGTPSRRFEPILKNEEEEVESPRPIGTIRRNRPPAITTDSAAQSYGTYTEVRHTGERADIGM